MRPDVTLLRTPAGNFGRLRVGLERAGARVHLRAPEEISGAESALVLAGVSSFSTISRSLARARPRVRAMVRRGTPVLGVCAGFQALYESSEEGPGRGLGLLPGRVRRLRSARVPNLGWSRLLAAGEVPRLMSGVPPGSYAYFAHSFRAPLPPPDSAPKPSTVLARYEGEPFPAALEAGRLWGLQFHPEISSRAGARVLANFVELCAEVGA